MVMDTFALNSPAREDMSEVLLAADRAADLTRRLLVFSRKEVVDVIPVNINALMHEPAENAGPDHQRGY